MIPPRAEVRDPQAAQVILNLRQRRYLKPFLGRECSVPQAAAEIEARPNSLLYQVRRLQRLGLLVQTGQVRRQGRAQKLYRASADSFYVPFRLYDRAALEEILMDFDLPWLEFFNRNLSRAMLEAPSSPDGFLMERQTDGRVRVQFASHRGSALRPIPPDTPSILSDWLVLRLTPAEARALQQEQLELFGRYAGRKKGRPYALLLGITPITVDTELIVLAEGD